ISWAIGTSDQGLRVYVSFADARRNGTHTNWSQPKQILQQTAGVGENGSLPRVTPDGRVWVATSSTRGIGAPYTMSYTSSRDGGRRWARRRVIVRHDIGGSRKTTLPPAVGQGFHLGPRTRGRL